MVALVGVVIAVAMTMMAMIVFTTHVGLGYDKAFPMVIGGMLAGQQES